jgi:hypothetical protein
MPAVPLPARPAFRPVLTPPARVYVPPPRSAEELAADHEAAHLRDQACKNSPSGACEVAGLCFGASIVIFTIIFAFMTRSTRP